MNITLSQKIENWAENNLKNLSVHSPASIHLDMLLHKNIDTSEILLLSIQSFQVLVNYIQSLQAQARPGVVIPLAGGSTYLQATVPNHLEDISRQLDDEPPSLYLLDWEVGKYLEICEEYKCPLNFNLIKDIEGVYAYYREFRGKLAIENEWEFSRAIYIEYYPTHYRLL